ncbi:PIG-L deacetylase family protein [Cerasicoccus arenae]|uniref:LmbE family protein n=1 Tax=Cerasicoccus arenae TaxID=424488 RepID=A0A8J3DFN8_9BACT|nr:PIG-L deacetylase family protein [Cerasicoccus arenae]MBK1858845.1 PIG-L family deacetylase [Cerasicoccus arenae]GHB96009.1 hypothetical protein GCM10007047_09660 [Cerasicoccus arenae]
MVKIEPKPIVLAAAAHPDDIEFCFAGTLLLLKEAGCDIHMWNLANGCYGDMVHSRDEVAHIRWGEAQDSAKVAGAIAHPPLFDDLSIFYDRDSIAAVSAVVREIRPSIILTHSPNDYMEDHQNACRLVVTAAFSRGMPNHRTTPQQPTYDDSVRIYHAAPHGLRDGLGELFKPDFLIDIEPVIPTKGQMLNCHKSQKNWLEETQEMDAYIEEMISMSREMADRDYCDVVHAEGWRRHSHLGFCPPLYNPLDMLLTQNFYPISTTTPNSPRI